MGKEIAIVDSSGVIKVSKKHIIPTGAQTFTSDGLLIPKRNFDKVNEILAAIDKKRDSIRATVDITAMVGALGMIATAFIVPHLIVLAPLAPLLLLPGVCSMFFTPSDNVKPLNDIKKAHALQLEQWLQKRYAINIDWRSVSDLILGEIVMNSMRKGHTLRFTATNGNDYILNQTSEGALFVEPVIYNLTTPEKVQEIEAATNPSIFNSADSIMLDKPVQNLLDIVKEAVDTLKIYDLTLEQQHVVNRAMEEANRAVETFMKIRKLKPTIDNTDTVDILTLVSKELSIIKEEIVEELQSELRAVNSHRS